MSTTRFHLVLTTSLATVLGGMSVLALQSGDAIGYPAGSVVSTGSNPVVSGGTSLAVPYYGSVSTIELITAPADQDLVVTDLILQPGTDRMSCLEQWDAHVTVESQTLAQFLLVTPFYYSGSYISNTHHGDQIHLVSGLRVPAGQSAELQVERNRSDGSYCYDTRVASVAVTWTGYLAQP